MKSKQEFVGSWRIMKMSAWDKEYIDLVAPGRITISKNGNGTFRFGAVEAELDCRIETCGEVEQLNFSFAGFDEGDEISGRGWAKVDGNKMIGWFGFHQGDDSTFEAKKSK